jgi:hypothetical protein
LVFPRNFDRIVGGGGDRVTEVFVLAQRFDHLTFDHNDGILTRGAVDESRKFVTLENATDAGRRSA